MGRATRSCPCWRRSSPSCRATRFFTPLRPELTHNFQLVMTGMRHEHTWQQALLAESLAQLPDYAEYIGSARASVGGLAYYLTVLILLDDPSTAHVPAQLDELAMQASLCVRLANDLATHARERAEGGVTAIRIHQDAATATGLDHRAALADATSRVTDDLHHALNRLSRLAATPSTATGLPERALLRMAHATCAQYARSDFRPS
ncbi:terpene synthase family protein [Kitasatospora sp. NPDC093558]|uniref:terpene synthase family protein n=1 Tax=Kitasatospora sp. NPDC093558 TaxID=3155201 RepID=UPI003413187F